MHKIEDKLINIRTSFSFLWDEYGFRLIGLMPKYGYRDAGYLAQTENDWCLIAFQSESGYLDDIGVVPKGGSSNGEFVSRWAFLTMKEEKSPTTPYTPENVFNTFAEFARPYLHEMLEFAKNPAVFNQRLNELRSGMKSSLTIDMIPAEHAHLHTLRLGSSRGVALENLRKSGKDE